MAGRVKFTPREEGEQPSAPQPPYVIDFSSVVGVLKDILSEVKRIVTHLLEPKKNIIVAYPQRGGLKTVTQGGNVIIDYSLGDVTIPGQVLKDKLPRRLAATERYKSAFLYVSRTVNARIIDGGETRLETPIFPSTATIVNIDFDRIELELSALTQVYVVVALQPDGIPRTELADYYEGNPYQAPGNVLVAGTPVTINVFAVIGKNAHTGTVSNLSGAANLLVALSSDGVTFAGYSTIRPGQGLDLEKEDVHSINIDAAANNTPFEVFAH